MENTKCFLMPKELIWTTNCSENGKIQESVTNHLFYSSQSYHCHRDSLRQFILFVFQMVHVYLFPDNIKMLHFFFLHRCSKCHSKAPHPWKTKVGSEAPLSFSWKYNNEENGNVWSRSFWLYSDESWKWAANTVINWNLTEVLSAKHFKTLRNSGLRGF